jgi:hypothetical protein
MLTLVESILSDLGFDLDGQKKEEKS